MRKIKKISALCAKRNEYGIFNSNIQMSVLESMIRPCIAIDILIVLVKVTEWPPIRKIAAHSAYDMFHGIST